MDNHTREVYTSIDCLGQSQGFIAQYLIVVANRYFSINEVR